MTLAIAWIRQSKDIQELIIASDSRLRAYGAWDACPKIFPLPRKDSAIAFCGSTADAYPYILQLITGVAHHRASKNRSLDLTQSKGHFLRILNSMRSAMETDRGRPVVAEARFIIAGYCWRSSAFRLWQFRYDKTAARYILSSRKQPGQLKGVVAIGDPNYTAKERQELARGSRNTLALDDVQREFYRRLAELIGSRRLEGKAYLDMEPLEILVSMIRSKHSPYVGGAPQVIKIYKCCEVQEFGIEWPWNDGTPARSLMGRPLMPYEKYDVPFINAATLETAPSDIERDQGSSGPA